MTDKARVRANVTILGLRPGDETELEATDRIVALIDAGRLTLLDGEVPADDSDDDTGEPDGDTFRTVADLEAMTKQELLVVADLYSVVVNTAMTKPELLAALAAALPLEPSDDGG